jgi:hypothetical protein
MPIPMIALASGALHRLREQASRNVEFAGYLPAVTGMRFSHLGMRRNILRYRGDPDTAPRLPEPYGLDASLRQLATTEK